MHNRNARSLRPDPGKTVSSTAPTRKDPLGRRGSRQMRTFQRRNEQVVARPPRREPRHLRSGHPPSVLSVEEIPDGWQPQPLPFGHADVMEAVRELAPEADTTDPEWIHVSLPGLDVEVNVTDESPLESFALHVRASDRGAADAWVRRLLDRLGTRALDPESESGIFQG